MARRRRQILVQWIALAVSIAGVSRASDPASLDFSTDVVPVLTEFCTGCHSGDDGESGLSLESFAALQKGGNRGPAIVPGRSDASLLIRLLTGDAKLTMPPEDNPRPSEAEISVLRAWIDAGAIGPNGVEPITPELSTPSIAPAPHAEALITCSASTPDGQRLALGRYRRVDLVDFESGRVLAATEQLIGKVNRIAFSRDGSRFAVASGIPGLYGVAYVCRTSDASVLSQVTGHRDALYDSQLSPNGLLLATCSYDRQINLWEIATGKLARTLSGHTGAVFKVAFSADGANIASASADETVKVWSTATGERLDTLSQPEGEQYVVAISPNDRWIVAAGADRTIRKWQLISRDRAQINPLVVARAGHDSTVTELAFSPDASTLVSASEGCELILWDAATLVPRHRYELQPDVVTGIVFDSDGSSFHVARLDGSRQQYPVESERGGAKSMHASQAVPIAPPAPLGEDRLELTETEPNNTPVAANEAATSAVIRGVIAAPDDDGKPDVDVYRFHARTGQQCVLEIEAARQKSPLDSRIEVLDAAGKAVPRVVLQAVRPTYFTFRGHNSTDLDDFRLHGWEEMELNDYLYANGEVSKLWLYPRGPDSGFLVYPGIRGKRYTYFGTTAVTHALNEPCYIVDPHPPGSEIISNGLPQFTVFYENDDDGRQNLGADSRLEFTAPGDGDYLARVSDVRGWGGDDYRYTLTVRASKPDFQVTVNAPDLSISAGSGKEISIEAERIDEFEGEIEIDLSGLPPGFQISSPIVIEAGQTTAYATITADSDAPAPNATNAKLTKVSAKARIDGRQVVKEAIQLGELKLSEAPKILIHITPATEKSPAETSPADDAVQLAIAPGETISATVRVERNGYDGPILFGKEYAGRNLPHGVYVDNIGLNGFTLLENETERTIFITAAGWVSETMRPFHLRADAEGNQTSWPVLLHVHDLPEQLDTKPVAATRSHKR